MKSVKMVGFEEIFRFAEKEFGIHWNPANDLFFNTIFAYRSCTLIYTCDLACDISYFKYANTIAKIKKCKASIVPREEFDKMTDREKAKLIVMLYCEHNKVKHDFYVNSL